MKSKSLRNLSSALREKGINKVKIHLGGESGQLQADHPPRGTGRGMLHAIEGRKRMLTYITPILPTYNYL